MFRVCLVAKGVGVMEGQNFNTKPEADEYVLSIALKHGVKKGYILNTETDEKEIIEDL